jgi:hypothetical protein
MLHVFARINIFMIQFELDSNARRAQSDFAIHPTAEIFGEPASLLSMTALWAAAEGGCEAIIDQAIRSPPRDEWPSVNNAIGLNFRSERLALQSARGWPGQARPRPRESAYIIA